MKIITLVSLFCIATSANAGCGQLCTNEFWETATPEAIAERVSLGDDPNAASETYGYTPLHFVTWNVSEYGHLLPALIDAGADVNVPTRNWHVPYGVKFEKKETRKLKYAIHEVFRGVPVGNEFIATFDVDILKILVEAGAKTDFIDPDGKGLVHLAVGSTKPELLHYVMSLPNTDIHTPSAYGRLPIEYAISGDPQRTLDMLKAVVSYGGDLTLKPQNKQFTLLHVVASEVHDGDAYPELLQYLLQAGLDINALDEDGRTPLHVLRSRFGSWPRTDTIKYYLDIGADPCIADNNGVLPVYANGMPYKFDLEMQKDDPDYQRLVAASESCEVGFWQSVLNLFD